MMTFHKIIYLVAEFVRIRTYRVVKTPKTVLKMIIIILNREMD